MPKINAPTVREHHEKVMTALIDAAERILREEGPDQLTAGAVSAQAGVARNSIYRYVESVNDLQRLVVERYMPSWFAAVQEGMDASDDPAEQIVAWARVNLEQASHAGHGWMMRSATGALDPAMAQQRNAAHGAMFSGLGEAWSQLSPDHARLGSALVINMVTATMTAIEHGADPQQSRDDMVRAVRAVVTEFRQD